MKLDNIADLTDWEYLDPNPDFANQLVATLNKVDGFSSNNLWFAADSWYWTYDYWISPHYEIDQDTFAIGDDQISIRSTNRDDLLNVHYYQQLSDLVNNYPVEKYRWIYFAQNQVLQLDHLYKNVPYFNIKLTKPIDQYNQKQINVMGKFMTNARDLIIKHFKLDWEQFDKQWKQGFSKVRSISLVFDLNDVANPKILLRWWNKGDNQYKHDYLKQVLKADTPLLKFLNEFDFRTHFQPYQSRANKFFKKFLDT